MKALTYLVALLAGLAYSVALVAWLLGGLPATSPAAALLAGQAPTAFVSAAWLVGTGRYLAGGARSSGPEVHGIWWRRTGLAVASYGAIVALILPLATGAPWLPSAVVLGSGAALVAAGAPAGGWIATRHDANPSVLALRMPTAERQLAIRGAVVGVSSQAIFWASLLQTGSVSEVGLMLLASTQLAVFGTGVAALAAGLLFRDRILHDARVNPDQARLLHRVVCRGAGLPADNELRRQAVRYAVAIPYLSFFTLLFLPLILLAAAVQRLEPGPAGTSVSSQLLGVALAVALVLVTVHHLRQQRAAVRFARAHTAPPSGIPDRE